MSGPNQHVLPRGDLVSHDDSDDCPCGPAQQPVTRDDGSIGWVVVHHSLDNREFQQETRA